MGNSAGPQTLGATLVTPVAEALARRGVPFVVSGRARSISSNPLLVEAPRLPKPARTHRIAQALAVPLEPS